MLKTFPSPFTEEGVGGRKYSKAPSDHGGEEGAFFVVFCLDLPIKALAGL